ncbi:hypothetical protein CFIMG_005406RA [Ceratocystis fimbriata CBS 114723]|uniref:Uncharacterized protein n=2 Tax=Ceratocystis TaxID=5157 RepID=A0A0F8DLM9_CERFI|nr:hypothetical protein CFO_g850 [Ceratocystis platani]PHH52575.1 hypothetical protein CFIMG_005406RA [Ceratocystis fimbriata CBS 114723]
MAPHKRMFKTASSSASSSSRQAKLPKMFKKAPETLEPFVQVLDPDHVYITHIDSHPIEYKKKIFFFSAGLNILIVLLFALRMRSVAPFYWDMIRAALNSAPADMFNPKNANWESILWEGLKRAVTMSIDLGLCIFVWPWPVEFCMGSKHGNPVNWRFLTGFRKQEVSVRRSQDWDKSLGPIFEKPDILNNFMIVVRAAIAPSWINRKTAYLMINGEWSLDWDLMMVATAMVDQKDVTMDEFDRVVLMHHKDFGWLVAVLEKDQGETSVLHKRQVLAFKDALTALNKENLFYRWVEIVQYEATSPGGFTADKQEAAAKKIRDMFKEHGIEFDQLWKDSTSAVTGAS